MTQSSLIGNFLLYLYGLCVTVDYEGESYFTFLYQRANEQVPFLERPDHPHQPVTKVLVKPSQAPIVE